MRRLLGHIAGGTIRTDQAAAAWVSFVGASGAINRAYNVTSVTRNAAADFTVTFSRAFAGASTYAISGSGELYAAGASQGMYMAIKQSTVPTSTSVTVMVGRSNGFSGDPNNGTLVAVGTY